jgi:ankyrin repeat protein
MIEKMLLEINMNNINKVKDLIDQGIDVNLKNKYGWTALILATELRNKSIIKLLLNHPNIIISDKICLMLSVKNILIDYQLQKNILNNNRVNILILFNQYGLINSKIKDENKHLFQANDWGLI